MEASQIYFVAKNGNDNNPGTETQPWKTLTKAGNTATAGDTIYIKQGTYNEQFSIQHSGTENNPITFTTYQNDEVIIDGTSIPLSWDGLIRIIDKSYITIKGLTIQNSQYFGIYSKYSSNNIKIENNQITNCQSSAIIIYPSSTGNPHHIYIYNNTIDTTCMNMNQESISLSNVNYFEITNNKVFNSYKEGIDVKSGCRNGIIQENEVSNHDPIRPCIYIDAYEKDSYNIIVERNIAYNNGQGICLATEKGGTLENIKVYNNIIYTKSNGLGIHRFTTSGSHQKKDIYIINNIFHMLEDATCIMLTDNEEHFTNLVVRNNILSGTNYHIMTTNFNDYTNIHIDHNLFTATSNEYGTNYIKADPKFKNPSNADFQLQPDSPAIDQGSPQNAPTTDYNGITRPQGEQIDIGAYEYINNKIFLLNEKPSDNAINVPNTIKNISIEVSSLNNDLLYWTIETQPNIGFSEGVITNGTIILPISNLDNSTRYSWIIRVTNGKQWNNESFCFTTQKDKRLIYIINEYIQSILSKFPHFSNIVERLYYL